MIARWTNPIRGFNQNRMVVRVNVRNFDAERDDVVFCRHCALRMFEKWAGWPQRKRLPLPPILADGVCQACGGHDTLLSSKIAWHNLHGGGSSGLPSAWVLSEITPRSQELTRWGYPYFKLSPCPNCRGHVLSSLFVPAVSSDGIPWNWSILHKCTRCRWCMQEEAEPMQASRPQGFPVRTR